MQRTVTEQSALIEAIIEFTRIAQKLVTKQKYFFISNFYKLTQKDKSWISILLF